MAGSHASSRIRTVCQETEGEMLYMGAERSAHMNPTPQNKTRGIKVPESAKTRRENVKLAVHGKAW